MYPGEFLLFDKRNLLSEISTPDRFSMNARCLLCTHNVLQFIFTMVKKQQKIKVLNAEDGIIEKATQKYRTHTVKQHLTVLVNRCPLRFRTHNVSSYNFIPLLGTRCQAPNFRVAQEGGEVNRRCSFNQIPTNFLPGFLVWKAVVFNHFSKLPNSQNRLNIS